MALKEGLKKIGLGSGLLYLALTSNPTGIALLAIVLAGVAGVIFLVEGLKELSS